MTSQFETKFEKFDRNIAQRLLQEDDSVITPEEKKTIKRMLKKVKGDLLKVEYNFAKGYENLRVGRVYADGGNSLGCMNGYNIRAPMCEKYYWDIDVVNCHYTIAAQYASKLNLPTENIKNYVENREQVLEKLMDEFNIDRSDAKILMIKIGYGGKMLPEDCPEMSKDIDVKEAEKIVGGVIQEMTKLAEYVWDHNESWQNLRLRRESNILKQSGGSNKNFKMLALFFQTKEREILQELNKSLTLQGRSVDILIHDGCMVRKNDNELEFPQTILDTCQQFIEESTGYNIKLQLKPIIMEWDFAEQLEEDEPEAEPGQFTGFWKTHFLMNGKLYKESEHYDQPEQITSAQSYVMQFHKEFNCKGKAVWESICTEPKRNYTTFGFYPYGKEVPKKIYNTFKGFKWTSLYDKPGLLTTQEYENLLKEIGETPQSKEDISKWDSSKTKWQIEELLCYNEDEKIKEHNIQYLLNTLGRILFNPTKPTEKVLCLRNEVGGSGKTGLLERHFADKLLGEEYFTSQSSSKQVFGEFNASIAGKLFILCEEAETKDTKDFTAQIKAAVTRKRNPIRKMRTDTYMEDNYCTYIANTNKQTAFEFDPKNRRRFPQIDCKEYTLTQEDENQLGSETNNPVYNKLFLEYILRNYKENFDFNQHPTADSVNTLKDQFKSPFIQFFEVLLYHWGDYYREKCCYVVSNGKPNLLIHELDTWTVKAEVFCEMYKEITKVLCGPEFSSKVKFAAFRQNKEMTDLMTKHPKYFYKKVVNYKGKEDRELGTFYTIELKYFREWFNTDFVEVKKQEPKKTIPEYIEEELQFILASSPSKKHKTETE